MYTETELGEWIPKNSVGNPFFKECEKITKTEELFNNFKTNNIFCQIIGNDVRDFHTASLIFEKIKNSKLLENINLFKTNDEFGSPIKYFFENLGEISPGTLYFIYILDDIIKKFGNLQNFKILEIGSGYGGQAKIILDNICQKYTCVDVKEPLFLCKKYLNLFNFQNVNFLPVDQLEEINFEDEDIDLVISNWCLSEFNINGIKYYIDKIIRYCNKGYFMMNVWDQERKNFLISEFKKYFDVVETEAEHIQTHSNQNFLLYVSKLHK